MDVEVYWPSDHQFRSRWIPLAAVVITAIVFDVLVAAIGMIQDPDYEVLIGASIGIFFAQVVGTAVATTMLPVHPITRIILGLFSTLFICAALAGYMREGRSPVPLILAATAFCQWLIYQLPLWSIRVSGWSLGWRDDSEDSTSQESQFGLRQIFVWTGIVAVLLSIARLLTGLASNVEAPDSTDWSIFGILTLGNSVLVLPMIWAAFVRSQVWAWTIGAIAWACVQTPIQLSLLGHALPLSNDEWWLFCVLNVAQIAGTMAILFAMRFAGLRLNRK